MTCSSCGVALPVLSTLERCGRCAISSALEPSAPGMGDDALLEAPAKVGAYELHGVIGRGGMGVVYRARRAGLDRDVALKMILAGAHAGFDEVRRFELEAEAAATLEHPHIVPVYEVGEHDGLPWFVMRLMEGGSLATRRAEFQDPARAAALIATVARAVRFGHRRGVIHRDLKPDNILFDAHDTPYVADFGVARRLGSAEDAVVAGTPGYLAPEALAGEVTTQADVYSLGAILRELVTSVAQRLPRDLNAICDKALDPDLERRYVSADALQLDLEAFIAGRPVSARKQGRAARSLRWALAHPFTVAMAFAVTCAAVMITSAGVRVAEQQETELRDEALQANAFAAQALAGAVRFELSEHARRVEDVAKALAQDERALSKANAHANFDSWLLLDAQGVVLAREPAPPPGFVGTSLIDRDYVRGARELGAHGAPAAYVSRAFISAADQTRRFAIASAVFDGRGDWTRIVAATLTANRTLGPLSTGRDSRRVAVLAAPLESTDRIIALVHPRLLVGEERELSSLVLAAVLAGQAHATTTDADYREDGERWLAGIARVGDAPLAVIVQTRWSDAAEPNRSLLKRFAARGLIPVSALTIAALMVAAFVRRRARRL